MKKLRAAPVIEQPLIVYVYNRVLLLLDVRKLEAVTLLLIDSL